MYEICPRPRTPSLPAPYRARKDAAREKLKLAPTIDIGRHYAALLANRDHADGNEDRGLHAAAAAASLALAADSNDRVSHAAQGFNRGRRVNSRISNNRTSRRRKSSRTKDSKAHDFGTSMITRVGPLSWRAESRSQWGDVAMHDPLHEEAHPREVRRLDNKSRKEESANDLLTREVVVKGGTPGEPRTTVETEQESNGKNSRLAANNDWAMWDSENESRSEQEPPGLVKAEGKGRTAEEGARQQQGHSPEDVGGSHSSDYGEESFESTDESEAVCPAPGVEEINSLISRGDAGDVVGNNFEKRQEPACSGHGGASDETLSKESITAAAALRIESWWRGFLGRCAAKYTLRSELLTALRYIGGGKISKVTDTAEGTKFNPVLPPD